MSTGKDNEFLVFHFNKHKFQLLDLCSEVTKYDFMKLVFSKTTNPILFAFKAVKTFVNKESINKLSNNYSLIDEKEAEDFVKLIKTTNENITCYTDFLDEIGLTNYFSSSFTECDNLISSANLARNQGYVRMESSIEKYLIKRENISNNSNSNRKLDNEKTDKRDDGFRVVTRKNF